MSKKANKTLIGAFVVGAVMVLVAGLLILGSGRFFTNSEKFVLYFEGSVKGLNIGAPVMFRGVKVGSVQEIQLRFNPEDLSIHIPVIIEIEPYRFERESGKAHTVENIRLLVERGLKAQLQLQSVVTGQLMVDLDFRPDEPLRLARIRTEYLQLPTVPSDLEKLSRTLENIPFDQIVTKLASAIEGIEKVINSPDLTGGLSSLNQTLKDMQKLLRNIDSQISPLASSIKSSADAAQAAFTQIEKTLALEEGAPGELASGIKELLSSVRGAMAQAEQTLNAIEGLASQDSSIAYELKNTLTELTSAARSVRFLADYLERHPESLLRGKGGSKGE